MVTTTNKDYDLGETTKAVRSQLIGLAIVSIALFTLLHCFTYTCGYADYNHDLIDVFHAFLPKIHSTFIHSIDFTN